MEETTTGSESHTAGVAPPSAADHVTGARGPGPRGPGPGPDLGPGARGPEPGPNVFACIRGVINNHVPRLGTFVKMRKRIPLLAEAPPDGSESGPDENL